MTLWSSHIKCVACLCWLVSAQSFSQTVASPSQSKPSTQSYLKEATISESAGRVRISANNPRPLAQVLDALQKKYGWAVNYEDPQYVSKMDMIETKESGKAATDANLPQELPSGGAFTIEFPSSPPVEAKLLQLAVDAYNQSDNPGKFELRAGKSGSFAVVGVKAHDTNNQMVSSSPVFDEPITIPSQQRTVLDTTNLICQQISAQRKIAITLGVFPQRVLAAVTSSVDGTRVPARDLLEQALSSMNRPFYTRLLFDPVSKGYVLDIHLLPKPK